jgi:hypothetical protein
MTRGVRFTEQMKGWLSFDETDFNQALLHGRVNGTSAKLRLTVEIRDLGRFIDERSEQAAARGWLEFDELGGRLMVEAGRVQLFARVGDGRHMRMRYRLFLRDQMGRPLTLAGFKLVEDDSNFDSWRDVTTLFVRLFVGHIEERQEADGRVVATGILRLSAPALVRQLISFRGQARSWFAQVGAVARFQIFFVRELLRAYWGPEVPDARPSFPRDRAPRDGGLSSWHEVPGKPTLLREIVRYTAGEKVGLEQNLHHLRRRSMPAAARPVLLSHGAGLRAQLFYGQPSGYSLAEALLDEGYDVWVQNWRGSIDFPPRDYTLDEVAKYDHPAAVDAVLQRSEASELKAVVHCQGSISFTMAAVAGLLPKEVTHVVSSAVSLHVRITPRSRAKQLLMLPVAETLLAGEDAQWGIRSPSLPANALAAAARLARREPDCGNPVCAMASYMYGTGRDVLLLHENVEPEVHAWLGRELGYTPFRLIDQLVKSVGAGHVVPAKQQPRLPADYYVADPPETEAAFTFLVGSRNRMFLPEGQQLTFEHFDSHAPGRHRLFPLDGFGHLDTIVGGPAAGEPLRRILEGLEL